jgi:UDP-N-acetylglucosamine--N-acetylmuramyl-(pentapeptide) pyrophosphoryl-undecaprenol N-acetylglucosamine transferase
VRRFALIAAGGTGGHIQPAVAVAQSLVSRGHDRATIHFVGSSRGLDSQLVPEAGFALTRLPGRGIPRRLGPAAVAALAGLAVATLRAAWLVGRNRPAVVLVAGGYASLPCAAAAVLWRVPIVVVEQNAVAGAVNRLVGRFARAAAVSFPGTGLPREVVTGNPVRAEVEAVRRTPQERDAARERLGLPAGRRVVAAMGGSLGSRRINEAVIELAGLWRARSDLALYHVIGARDYADLGGADRGGAGPSGAELGGGEPGQDEPGRDEPGRDEPGRDEPAAEAPALVYRAVEYERRMPDVLAAAEVMVARAGGSTVAELATVGVPAVLVPLPGAPGDHQTANARVLSDAGAALLLADDRCDGGHLAELVGPLLDDPGRLPAMASAAASLARPGAAHRVADLMEQVARR